MESNWRMNVLLSGSDGLGFSLVAIGRGLLSGQLLAQRKMGVGSYQVFQTFHDSGGYAPFWAGSFTSPTPGFPYGRDVYPDDYGWPFPI